MSLAKLRETYPWPAKQPAVPPRDHGWFSGRAESFEQFTGPHVKVYLELGSWLGKSARWFADHCPNAIVLCIDHWQGSPEHYRKAKWKKHLPTLYETFLTNLWDLRERIVPIRANTLEGMKIVAEAGVQPDLVYIDAGHDTESIYHDLRTAMELFPQAQLLGDDWPMETVRAGVHKVLAERGEEVCLRSTEAVWFLNRTISHLH